MWGRSVSGACFHVSKAYFWVSLFIFLNNWSLNRSHLIQTIFMCLINRLIIPLKTFLWCISNSNATPPPQHFQQIIITTMTLRGAKKGQEVENMAVLTFVSESLLGGWTSRPQQQTEKQAARQAHRGNPAIRAYNRHAPSAQSFICWRAEPQGGSDREGWRDGDLSGSNTPPTTTTTTKKRKGVCPTFIVAKASPGWVHGEEDGDEEECFHH